MGQFKSALSTRGGGQFLGADSGGKEQQQRPESCRTGRGAASAQGPSQRPGPATGDRLDLHQNPHSDPVSRHQQFERLGSPSVLRGSTHHSRLSLWAAGPLWTGTRPLAGSPALTPWRPRYSDTSQSTQRAIDEKVFASHREGWETPVPSHCDTGASGHIYTTSPGLLGPTSSGNHLLSSGPDLANSPHGKPASCWQGGSRWRPQSSWPWLTRITRGNHKRKKGGKTDFPETKRIQRDPGCQSVSPAGLTWRASQCRRTRWAQNKRPCSLPTRSPPSPELRQSQAGGQPHGRTSPAPCALGLPRQRVPRLQARLASLHHGRVVTPGDGGAGEGPTSVLIWIFLEETLELGIHPSRARADGKSRSRPDAKNVTGSPQCTHTEYPQIG
ncbi:uncharacterized protein LOC106698448 [Myotis lucifugus]|uniref:uncharacterized protein LOC106698448 n=1 Tax=Myotis lucifugus TaxID=59463 RepID=UPI000CCBF4E5|nr:uncharacterized protein LOC106698448 [Myotis lucifugus]